MSSQPFRTKRGRRVVGLMSAACAEKRTTNTPAFVVIDKRVVVMAISDRPQGAKLRLSEVLLLSCSAVPSGSPRAGTGSNRGGEVMAPMVAFRAASSHMHSSPGVTLL